MIGPVLMLKHSKITDELRLEVGFVERVTIETMIAKDENIF